MRNILLVVASFLLTQVSLAQNGGLLKDINPGLNASLPTYLTSYKNRIIFSASDGVHGNELWKSNGPDSTVLIKDIRPGVTGSGITDIEVMNDFVYFSANDGINGFGLWRTDGTEAGTILVKSLLSGSEASRMLNMTTINNTLYFSVSTGAFGHELWKSNGTAAGTVLVKDITPGVGNTEMFKFTAVNGILYFVAQAASQGFELWRSNGTAAGTILVKDINPGTAGGAFASELVDVNGVLYFSANNGTSGYELWKSNGTPAGTVLVKDIYTGSGHSFPQSFKVMNGVLYFAARTAAHGFELWKSNGTSAGTVMVRDIVTGSASSLSEIAFTKINMLYFIIRKGSEYQLWSSSGTSSGTRFIKTVSNKDHHSYVMASSGLMYLLMDNVLWESDGTAEGTKIVLNTYGIAEAMYPSESELINSGDIFFFRGNNPTYGKELHGFDARHKALSVRLPLSSVPTYRLSKGQYVDYTFRYYSSNTDSVSIKVTPVSTYAPITSVVSSPAKAYPPGKFDVKGYFSSLDSAVVTHLKFTFSDPQSGTVFREELLPLNIVFRNIAQASPLQATVVYGQHTPYLSLNYISIRNNSDTPKAMPVLDVELQNLYALTSPVEGGMWLQADSSTSILSLQSNKTIAPHESVTMAVYAIIEYFEGEHLDVSEHASINGAYTTLIMNHQPQALARKYSLADTDVQTATAQHAVSVYPNPVQTNATFQVQLEEDSHVLLRISDMQGNTVTTVANTQLGEGTHSFDWNNPGGQQLYIYQLFVNGALTTTGKILTK